MAELLKVLIVDDEPGMRTGAMRALKDFRLHLAEVNTDVLFEVEAADSGEQALEMMADHAPDLLLLDHKLPGMSGLDVLDHLANKPETEFAGLIIMITAYASLETAITAIKRGAYDFLAKPFTPSELKAMVRKASESLILSRHARKLAQEKRQVRFQFVSVLAHELKAPLAAIEGYLQIMKDRSAGDDPQVYQHMLERSLVRLRAMRKLIIDLLDLTRIESGQKKRDLAEVDIREVAQASLELFHAQAQEKHLAVHFAAPAPVPLLADRGEIEIILNNLISNAIKYNREGGRVDITIDRGESEIAITVTDTGIGMAPEEAVRLFNDFVRIKNEKTRNILGSGLGLSIVKKLAQLYGGDAQAHSTPDVGSTFTVTLKHKP